MSGIDYSKWDNIEDSSSDEEVTSSSLAPPAMMQQQQAKSIDKIEGETVSASRKGPQKIQMTKEGSEKGRYRFEYEGRLIYEWDQSLDEVNLYIKAPEGTKARDIDCKIKSQRVTIGLEGNPPFLDEETFAKVKTDDSSWYLNDEGQIHIVLIKVIRGVTWDSALKGRSGDQAAVDPFTKEKMQKDLMLEKFQEENPGFDFRDAQFNGAIPDPSTFMGGVQYS